MAQAHYTVYDQNNTSLKTGVLNTEGKASVPLNVSHDTVKVRFHDDPPVNQVLRQTQPQWAEVNQVEFERAYQSVLHQLNQAWDSVSQTVIGGGQWLWGVIEGDFNSNPTSSQIITNAIVTAIPVIDQVADVRDIIANLKVLAWDKRYNEYLPWVALFFTLIGLIPVLGSLLKGVLKLVWKGAHLDQILKVFNYFMKGNGVTWLKALKNGELAKYSQDAAKLGHQVITSIMGRINQLQTRIPRGFTKAHEGLNNLIRNLQTVKSRIDGMFKKIAEQLGEKLGKILGDAKDNIAEVQGKTTFKKQQQAEASKKGGKQRAEKFSANWPSENLKNSIGKFAGHNPIVTTTAKGKKIYTNPDSGIQIVQDVDGNYFRIHDPSIKGKRSYLDVNGNIPNNKILENGKQVGRSQAEYNQATHFNIEE